MSTIDLEYFENEFELEKDFMIKTITNLAGKLESLNVPNISLSIGPGPDCRSGIREIDDALYDIDGQLGAMGVIADVETMVAGYKNAEQYALGATITLEAGTRYTENSMGQGRSNTIREDNIYARPDDEYVVKYIAIYANGNYKYNMILGKEKEGMTVDEKIAELKSKGLIGENDTITIAQGITKKIDDKGTLGDIGWLKQVEYTPKEPNVQNTQNTQNEHQVTQEQVLEQIKKQDEEGIGYNEKYDVNKDGKVSLDDIYEIPEISIDNAIEKMERNASSRGIYPEHIEITTKDDILIVCSPGPDGSYDHEELKKLLTTAGEGAAIKEYYADGTTEEYTRNNVVEVDTTATSADRNTETTAEYTPDSNDAQVQDKKTTAQEILDHFDGLVENEGFPYKLEIYYYNPTLGRTDTIIKEPDANGYYDREELERIINAAGEVQVNGFYQNGSLHSSQTRNFHFVNGDDSRVDSEQPAQTTVANNGNNPTTGTTNSSTTTTTTATSSTQVGTATEAQTTAPANNPTPQTGTANNSTTTTTTTVNGNVTKVRTDEEWAKFNAIKAGMGETEAAYASDEYIWSIVDSNKSGSDSNTTSGGGHHR